MSLTPKHEKHASGGGDSDPGGGTPNDPGSSTKPRGSRLARRARSFKDDFLEVLSQMRSSGAAGSGGGGVGGGVGGGSAGDARSGSPQSPKSRTPVRTPVRSAPRQPVDGDRNPLRDLDAHVRQVQFALKHFNDVVGNKKLEVLPGNGTVVLETVTLIHSTLKNSLLTEQSSLLTSAMNQVYQSVARLIRLCDDVLLHQDKALTKESAVEVVQCVEDAVQNLVTLAQDKIANRENMYKNNSHQNQKQIQRPSAMERTSAGFSLSGGEMLAGQRNSLPDIPLTPREKQILEQTSHTVLERHLNHRNHSHSSESILDVVDSGSPPPKPPFPTRRWCGRSSPGGEGEGEPPPLPPKQRVRQLVAGDASGALSALSTLSAEMGGAASLLAGLEAMSLRSKSPEDTSSLLSASAGSLDSVLNHSRDEDEELRALMEPGPDAEAADVAPSPADNALALAHGHGHGVNDSLNGSGSPCCCCDPGLQQNILGSPVPCGHSFVKGFQKLSSSQLESGFASLCSSTQTFTSTSTSHQRTTMVVTQTQQRRHRQGQISDEPLSFPESQQSEAERSSPSGSASTPPAIPQKTRSRRSRRERLPSQYDNVPSGECSESDQQLHVSCSLRAIQIQGQSHQLHMSSATTTATASASMQHLCSDPQGSYQGSSPEGGMPPPLPPKKKHIMAYMEMFGNCTHPSSNDLLRHSVHSYNMMKMSSTQSCSFVQHFHRESSSSSPVESSSPRLPALGPVPVPSPAPSPAPSLPPALPPKRRRTWSVRSAASPPPASPPPALPPTSPRSVRDEMKVEESRSPSASPTPSPQRAMRGQRGDLSLEALSPALAPAPATLSAGSGGPERSPSPAPVKVSNPLEEIDVSRYLVLKKAEEDGPDVRGGSVDCLLVYATKAIKNENETDFLYQEAFLTTYRTFLTPLELIRKLCHRHQHFCCSSELVKQRAAKESFSLLVRVVNDLTISDMDDTLVETLTSFVYQLLCSGDLTMAKALRVKILEKYTAKQLFIAQMSMLPSKDVSTRNYSLLDFKSEQIAEQMTLLDAQLFMKIEIPEVLIWAQEQNEERSPNLTRFTEHFNKMSYWARSRILEQKEAKERERYVVKFIKIMKHLRKMNNFNSYLALLSALDSAPIRRLEWQKHITEGLKEYCALIDSSSSFRAYRQALADTQPPCIPYIGLVLQDLTFVHIGNSDLLPEGTINFSKRWQQFNIVENMKRFKKATYVYKKQERIIAFFNNFDNCLCEEAMWQMSEAIKPRGGKKPAATS